MTAQYGPATAEADHITTRLRMDATEASEKIERAVSAIDGLEPILKQLDRLSAEHGDEEASGLASGIRLRLGEVIVSATSHVATDQPQNPLGWSPDARAEAAASRLRGRGTPYGPKHEVDDDVFFIDVD